MRFGNCSSASMSGPIAPRSSSSSPSLDDDRALRVADRDVLEVPGAAAGDQGPPAVRAARGKVLGPGRGAAHLDRAGPLRGDRRRDRPRRREDREGLRVGPALAAQVEDRLAGPVAGELGLGAVGVEDPQLGDEPRVLAAREQQHPVGADPEMRVAEPLHPGRGQLPGELLRLEDQVVVAQRLPLLESHRGAAYSPRSARQYRAARPRRRSIAGRGRSRPGSGSCASRSAGGGRSCGSASSSARGRRRAARRSRAPCGRCARARPPPPPAPPRRRPRPRSPRCGRRSARRARRGPCRGRRSSSDGGSRGDQSSESSVPAAP